MVDTVTKETRSWIMSKVRRAHTKPEVAVRSMLHVMGYRFRLHDSRLPGRPDIVLKRCHAAIFVNGCFWHRHGGCKKTTTPDERKEFWLEKFQRNVERDKRNYRLLRQHGWRIMVVWECQVDDLSRLRRRVSAFLRDR
jgi:DNA mismatch endonuclease (patch repair protein)